jgi:hypothetical protein
MFRLIEEKESTGHFRVRCGVLEVLVVIQTHAGKETTFERCWRAAKIEDHIQARHAAA